MVTKLEEKAPPRPPDGEEEESRPRDTLRQVLNDYLRSVANTYAMWEAVRARLDTLLRRV